MTHQVLPWHLENLKQYSQLHLQDALSHALMLVGFEGSGRSDFIKQLSSNVLCGQETACNACHNCDLTSNGNHPDLKIIQAEKNVIKVQAVRELIEWAGLSTHTSKTKIAIIMDAECMNIASSNALLKTLEEPASDTYIWLVSKNNHSLPATIMSRCQLIQMDSEHPGNLNAWLEQQLSESQNQDEIDLALRLTFNNPGQSLNYIQNQQIQIFLNLHCNLMLLREKPKAIEQVRNECSEINLNQFLDWFWFLTTEYIKMHVDPRAGNALLSKNCIPFQKVDKLFHILRYIDQVRLKSGTGMNESWSVLDLLLEWIKVGKT